MGLLKRVFRKGQTGQSLVILAIGFLALLGFVGIVTDVSVLFIRYSTMRRAVDAAAIAAAGQMRRVEDTKLNDPVPVADGQATSMANLNLAARQFIEVYGLNPKNVIVETCNSQQVKIDDATKQPMDGNGNFLFITNADGSKSPNPAADQETVKKYQQLCTADELKLVRVTAQIDAPTIFLRLLGYPTVTLTESAISQTAVIDVVMIFDVSESMMNETTYDDWDHIPGNPAPAPQGVRYMPPWVYTNDHGTTADATYPERTDPWDDIYYKTEAELDARIGISGSYSPATANDSVFLDKTIAFEPTTALGVTPGPTDWQEYGTAPSLAGRVEPRQFCRVRAYLGTVNGYKPDATLRDEYQAFFNNVYSLSAGHSPADDWQHQFAQTDNTKVYSPSPLPNPGSENFRGFVPMYNYYGCCNDPDGNFVFDDLICQPFKNARDAAHNFLNRLDFLRGDRVAFVTFDRQATAIDPDGDGPQHRMIETQDDIVDPTDPVNNNRKGADEVLDDVIGVRAEETFYSNINPGTGLNDGMWHGLMQDGQAKTYDQLENIPVGQLVDNPVAAACPMDTASLAWTFVPPAQYLPNGNQRKGGDAILDSIISVPDWYMTNGIPSDSPPTAPGFQARYRSYEYRASCAGTNMGAGLQAGASTLYDEGRREGAVWIMVLLSDGAAGASNPITKYGSSNIVPPDPYNTYSPVTTTGYDYDGTTQLTYYDPVTDSDLPVPIQTGLTVYDPIKGSGGPATSNPNSAGGYGAYGLCPYGTEAKPSQLISGNGGDHFPNCDDLNPETRHFCAPHAAEPDFVLDPNVDPDCFNYYDVDDYARDWADYVGLAQLPGVKLDATTGRVGDQLVPSIFTIGFGLNYDTNGVDGIHTACASDDYNCIRGIDSGLTAACDAKPNQSQKNTCLGPILDRNADYLGEELLRYIADVGDNNQIDNDWWQLCESKNAPVYPQNCRDDGKTNTEDRIGNPVDLTQFNWGARGACEQPDNSNLRGETWNPKPPTVQCGNYYNATTRQQLDAVFDTIASRMFTRLSQ